MKKLFFLAGMALALAACTVPRMAVEPDLAGQSVDYPVKGRQFVMIRKNMNFGPYSLVRLRKGWVGTWEIPWTVSLRNSKEKFAFSLTDGTSLSSAQCFAELETVELEIIRDYFGVRLDHRDMFSGVIDTDRDHTWEFVVYNPSNLNAFEVSSGYAQCMDRRIEIMNVREIEGQQSPLMSTGLYGYSFRENGRELGAVDMINNGRVILREDLPREDAFLLANLAAALLLKTDMADAR